MIWAAVTPWLVPSRTATTGVSLPPACRPWSWSRPHDQGMPAFAWMVAAGRRACSSDSGQLGDRVADDGELLAGGSRAVEAAEVAGGQCPPVASTPSSEQRDRQEGDGQHAGQRRPGGGFQRVTPARSCQRDVSRVGVSASGASASVTAAVTVGAATSSRPATRPTWRAMSVTGRVAMTAAADRAALMRSCAVSSGCGQPARCASMTRSASGGAGLQPGGEQPAAPAGPQVGRVVPVGQQRGPGGEPGRVGGAERAGGGLPAGGVGVEGDQQVGVGVCAQGVQLVGGYRGAGRGHPHVAAVAGEGDGDGVEGAFDQHRGRAAPQLRRSVRPARAESPPSGTGRFPGCSDTSAF